MGLPDTDSRVDTLRDTASPLIEFSANIPAQVVAAFMQVVYSTEMLLDKNKDFVVAEHAALLQSSASPLVRRLFSAGFLQNVVRQRQRGSVQAWTPHEVALCRR